MASSKRGMLYYMRVFSRRLIRACRRLRPARRAYMLSVCARPFLSTCLLTSMMYLVLGPIGHKQLVPHVLIIYGDISSAIPRGAATPVSCKTTSIYVPLFLLSKIVAKSSGNS